MILYLNLYPCASGNLLQELTGLSGFIPHPVLSFD